MAQFLSFAEDAAVKMLVSNANKYKTKYKLCPSDKDIVYWNVDELNEITNETHDRKTDKYCLANL